MSYSFCTEFNGIRLPIECFKQELAFKSYRDYLDFKLKCRIYSAKQSLYTAGASGCKAKTAGSVKLKDIKPFIS